MTRPGGLVLTLGVFALSGCSGDPRDDTATRANSASTAPQSEAFRDDVGSPEVANADEPGEADGVVYQTDDEARASDLALIAETFDWTLEEAELYQAKTEEVGEIAVQVAKQRPDQFVGSAVGPQPSDLPRLYLKGTADDLVRGLVAAAAFEIRIIDRQPFSMVELVARTELLARALIELGFQDFGAAANIEREGLLEATVGRAPGAPDSEAAILARLPAELSGAVSITLVDDAGFGSE